MYLQRGTIRFVTRHWISVETSVNSIEVNIGHQIEIRAPLYAQNCILSKRLEDDSMTLSSSHLKTIKTSKFPYYFVFEFLSSDMTRKTWFSAIPERLSYRHGMLYFHPVFVISPDINSLGSYVPSKRHHSFVTRPWKSSLNFSEFCRSKYRTPDGNKGTIVCPKLHTFKNIRRWFDDSLIFPP